MRFAGNCRRRDEGNGLQIRRAAASLINKQSRKADNGWSSWGVERRAKTRQRKTLTCYELEKRASDLNGFSLNEVSY